LDITAKEEEKEVGEEKEAAAPFAAFVVQYSFPVTRAESSGLWFMVKRCAFHLVQ